jgi:hypothetical protein
MGNDPAPHAGPPCCYQEYVDILASKKDWSAVRRKGYTDAINNTVATIPDGSSQDEIADYYRGYNDGAKSNEVWIDCPRRCSIQRIHARRWLANH